MKRLVFLLALIGLLVGNVNASMISTKNKITYTCRLAPGNNGYIEVIRIKTTVSWAPWCERLELGFVKRGDNTNSNATDEKEVQYSVTGDNTPLIELYEGCPYLKQKRKRLYYNRTGNGYKISARLKKRPAKIEGGYYYDIDLRIIKHPMGVFSFSDMDYILTISKYQTNEGTSKWRCTGSDKPAVVSCKYIGNDNNTCYYRKIYYSYKSFTHQGED